MFIYQLIIHCFIHCFSCFICPNKQIVVFNWCREHAEFDEYVPDIYTEIYITLQYAHLNIVNNYLFIQIS